ncbi:MAG TPA: glycerol acyltransferase [Flavobacteriaceae bacterium]|jgi:phage tail-like protein|nr:glycerol acyltransferase [Flavobacteriaceae bacterium]|tara:strand:+ start:129010 stop:129456 length:447 start_codon:yes stop_codon:yes gene_type:complete
MDSTITLSEFTLKVDFFKSDGNEGVSTQFKSVSGLTVDIDTEKIPLENPDMKFRHSFPSRTRFPNLTLKQGILKSPKVINWCKKAINQYQFSPTDINIKLVNSNEKPVLAWNIINAYPIMWTLKKQKTEGNNIAIDTMELAYNYFKLV